MTKCAVPIKQGLVNTSAKGRGGRCVYLLRKIVEISAPITDRNRGKIDVESVSMIQGNILVVKDSHETVIS